jgi:hypothetical protein
MAFRSSAVSAGDGADPPLEQADPAMTIRAARCRSCRMKNMAPGLRTGTLPDRVLTRSNAGDPMIRNLVARFTILAVIASACTRGDESNRDGSSRIVEAQAKAEDLANSTQSYQPVRFVSEIEQVRRPQPETRHVLAEVVTEGTESIKAETTTAPVSVAAPAEPEVASDSTTDATPPSSVPSIVPRSAPPPDAVASTGSGLGEWRGRDPGPDMGTVIGVVLRGGRVDPGHCPKHHPHPSQIPNRIPR